MSRTHAVLGLVLSLLLLLPSGPAVAATGDQRVDMRILLVVAPLEGQDGDGAAAAWSDAMARAGTPFDVVEAGTVSLVPFAGSAPTEWSLAVDADHARYQGVVTTAHATAALSAADEAALDWLQDTFGVRRITPYIWPQAAYGLSAEGVVGGAELPTATLTAAGRSLFGELAGPVPFDPYAWGYRGAQVVPGANFTPLLTWDDGSPAMGIHRDGGGREQLVALVDSNPWMLHTRALVPGMLRWLTSGTHLGHERRYLALHVDDVLLADDRWDAEANTTPEDGPNPIRMTAEDVDRAAAWSAATGQRLDMVFNGAGAQQYTGPDGVDPLWQRLLERRAAFGWINHTFTHLNLDYGEVGGDHVVDEDTIADEINRNVAFAADSGLDMDPSELVTGQHSGLTNPNMVPALARTPVLWIAADNSIEPEQYQLGSSITVPRYPANIYYNVGTRAEQLDEYNYIYFDGCTPSPVTTCLSQPATWQEYVDSEARIMLSHVVGNDPRPHYVHQSNLAEDGVLYDIVDEVLRRHDALFTTPIEQPTMTESGTLLQRATAWRAAVEAGAAGAYVQDGQAHLWADEPTWMPITGTTEGETYGGVRSAWVLVTGEQVLPLESSDSPTEPTEPTEEPTGEPTEDPTEPTEDPTEEPTEDPTEPPIPPADPEEPANPPIDLPPAQPEKGVAVRIGGADRVDTAVRVAQQSYDDGSADSAVIARADVFADALAGAPLAAAKGGPLLLTYRQQLHPTTAAELQRVLAPGATVFLLGGTAALSPEVAAAVADLGFEVVRFAGADRYETALRIVTEGLGEPSTLLLATGQQFPDALSAGAAAAHIGAAVLLTNGAQLSPAVAAYLAERPATQLYAVGGPAAAAVPQAEAITGADRFETSRRVAERFFSGAGTTVGLASGHDFPDALAGGPHVGAAQGALLLTQPTALHPQARTYLEEHAAALRTVFVYGGSNAISGDVEAAARDAIR